MQATYSVRLRERGQLTLPQPIRKEMSVDKGDVLTLVQIDDLFILSPRQALLPKLSEQFTAIMKEEGVSLAELLQGVEEERKLIWEERYSKNA